MKLGKASAASENKGQLIIMSLSLSDHVKA